MKLSGKAFRKKGRAPSGFVRPPGGEGAQQRQERRERALVLLLAFAVLSALLTEWAPQTSDETAYDIESEVIAQKTWKAEFPFDSVDLEATRKAEDEAAAATPDTYYVDRGRVNERLAALRETITAIREQAPALEQAIREALLAPDSSQEPDKIVSRVVEEFAAKLGEDPRVAAVEDRSALALWLTPAPESIPERVSAAAPDGTASDPGAQKTAGLVETSGVFRLAYDATLAELALEGLEATLTYGVLSRADRERALQGAASKSILIVRDQSSAPWPSSSESPVAGTPDVTGAKDFLQKQILELARRLQDETAGAAPRVEWTRLQNAAFAVAGAGLTDTLVYDRVATDGARASARKSVTPVTRRIAQGRVMQRDGEYWTSQSRADVTTYLERLQSGQTHGAGLLTSLAAHLLLVGLTLSALVKSLPMLSTKLDESKPKLQVALLVIVAVALVGRVSRFFEPTGYVVPVTAGAILVAILLSGRIAVMAAFVMSFLLSAQYGYDWGLLVVSFAMSSSGVLGIYKVRRRGDVTAAAFKATVVGLLAMTAVSLASDAFKTQSLLQHLGLILINEVACALMAPGLLSPLERIFGITTDFQLLEYSDLNNEVLSRLAIEVPATYAHSLMMGQLAEAAAVAVGANGLLARVCAYYHDIGKMRRPEYFSENQTGVNIHDDLSPRMSARAIASHVTEGAEMARAYKLPKPIIDGILEHHGTCLISFFYQQAGEQQKHGGVREEDFRYPGPKPRSRETAILMICDAVESGVRSIKNPNEERVREFVDKIIANRAEDRQFDDCELTLKDLDRIGDVVTSRILTAMHTRIAYPEKALERKVSNVIPMQGGQES